MQLSTIKISNLLSFPYLGNLTETQGIKFHYDDNGVINIMIGPNGSGKSNLMEIIRSIWKYGITINYEILSQINPDGTNQPHIIENNNPNHNLSKHRDSLDKPSHIYMSLLLSQHDIDNLCFLQRNASTINTIINTYSTLDVQFPSLTTVCTIQEHKVPLYFTIDTQNHDIVFHHNDHDQTIQFIYHYLQHFELIQICMELYNTHIKSPEQKTRYPLHNTFAIINAHDRTGTTTLTAENTTSQPKPIKLFLKKYQSLTPNESENISLLRQFFLESTNTMLQQYVRLHLVLQDNTILFKDHDGYLLAYHELSSGEQSFVSIILLLFSHDLQHGLLMIDEPEIHLHPQSQQRMLELLQDIQYKQHIQCIVATHSPSLITPDTIRHVFRYTKHHSKTAIHNPHYDLHEEDGTLIQLLKFDHVAKIFFVDNIILVEGETDMYFLDYYIKYLQKTGELPDQLDYEILTIGGKGGWKKRKHFLTKFDIQVHYVGDRDNVVEFGIIGSIDRQHHRHRTIGGSKYASTVDHIRYTNPDRYQTINKSIQNLYQQHVYLLQEGDLEAYIGLASKGLDETVGFCEKGGFEQRLHNPHYDLKRAELETIMHQIFDPTDAG